MNTIKHAFIANASLPERLLTIYRIIDRARLQYQQYAIADTNDRRQAADKLPIYPSGEQAVAFLSSSLRPIPLWLVCISLPSAP